MRALQTLLMALVLSLPALAQADDFSAGRALVQAGDFPGAVLLLEPFVEANADHAPAWYFLGYALHAQGKFEEALPAHEKAASFPRTAGGGAYNAACACAQLERIDEAFTWLEQAVAAGFDPSPRITTDPDLANLQGDPRLAPFLPPPLDSLPDFAEPVQVLHFSAGKAAGDQYGWVARRVGDVDADGTQDYASTAPTHTNAAGNPQGYVTIVSGKTGEVLHEWFSEQGGEQFGWCVTGAGDQNGDGHADVLIGAPATQTGKGHAYVYSGKDGERLAAYEGEAQSDRFGREVHAPGDVNGDGVGDLLIGAPGHDGAGAEAGRVYLLSGKDGARLATYDGQPGDQLGENVCGFVDARGARLLLAAPRPAEPTKGYLLALDPLTGEEAWRYAAPPTAVNVGWFLGMVGDVDADGIPDVYHTDWQDGAKGPSTGRATVQSGLDGRVIREYLGHYAGEGFGIGVGDAGDLNRDGFDDLVIGAWTNRDGAAQGGKIYLYSGRFGNALGAFTGTIPGATLGFDATSMGDADGDEVPDMLVTSAWDPRGGFQCGRTYVVSGASAVRAPGDLDPTLHGTWKVGEGEAQVTVEGGSLRIVMPDGSEVVLRR